MVFVEIATVLALILFNGLLAMSELAVVSARPARLRAKRDKAVRGARRALELASDSGRFLSTVQIGITLVGVLSGAFSGATLGVRLANILVAFGLSPGLANTIGVGIMVTLITYMSLIVGELVPKQIALRDPEGVAAKVAPFMTLLSRVTAPVVWLLDKSGDAVLWLLGQTGEPRTRVSDEEIRSLIADAERGGVIETGERRMITGVMRFADRQARAIMTPRSDVEWIDLSADDEDVRRRLNETKHSLVPAGEGSLDEIVGAIKLRDLFTARLSDASANPRSHVLAAPVVHDFAGSLDVLEMLQKADVPIALVHDEHGHFEGIITPADILEAIAGVFRSDIEEGEHDVVQRADGSWLLPGSMPADEVAELLGFSLPARHDYTTLAGFMLSHMKHVPKTGEATDAMDWRLEVVDMDGRRIDKVLAKRLEPAADQSEEAAE